MDLDSGKYHCPRLKNIITLLNFADFVPNKIKDNIWEMQTIHKSFLEKKIP